jgi:hypothetical protein
VTEWGTGFSPVDALEATEGGQRVEIELIGPNLRVRGSLSLGRFGRLSDRINYSPGFVHVHDVRVLERNGDPTALAVPELYVNPDDITFIAIPHVAADAQPPTATSDPRPMQQKQPRRYLVFTPGHAIIGRIHVLSETTLLSFVETADPRFVPMTDVAARSLVDQHVESRFDLALLNRTQMIAVAEADGPSGRPDDPAVPTGSPWDRATLPPS